MLGAFLKSADRAVKGVGRIFADLFFPMQCLECGADGVALCAKCLSGIKLSDDRLTPVGELDGLIGAAADYKQLEGFITLLKYDYVTELASPLASLMLRTLRGRGFSGEAVLVPVPLHVRRLRERGFNQSELLAREVSGALGWPLVNVLARTRRTRPQVGLGREDRLKNVIEAFGLVPGLAAGLSGKTVVLVDDVYTTGATIGECAKILRQAGVAKVYGLVLARG